MACLKISIGCLAAVGLIVVVVIILAVGGCVGLFAWGAAHGFGVPERATMIRIESDHSALLAEVQRQLESGGDLQRWRRPGALVALRARSGGIDDKDHDLLSGQTRSWTSHTLLNGAGIGCVDGHDCLVYVKQVGGREIWVYIADPGTPPAKPAPSGPE